MLKFLRRVACAAPLLVAEAAAVVVVVGAMTCPVAAQDDRGFFNFPFFNGRQQRRAPQYQYQYQQPQYQQPQYQQPQWQFWPQQTPRPRREHEQPVDASKAPPPRKQDTTPTTHVTVMGDSLADWLAYGLEDAFGETPEVGVVRKNKPNRGLIMGTSKNEYDWAAAAREILAGEKTDYVVMFLGLADRQPIHARATPARAAGPNQKPGQPNPPGQKPDTAKTEPPPVSKPEQPSSAEPTDAALPDDQPAGAPEPSSSTASTHEFRTEKWAEAYAKRIDEVIAALKSKGNPVFWVGLPAIRGTRATADMVYLNELFRGRAEKAGIIYVDIWDGFVDENGAYAPYGPDFEGQTRRLRSGDGVHFTKAGARKLAHYVEREIRRVMQARGTPTAMPTPDEPQPQAPKPGTPVARPAAGPVVSLTAPASTSETLLGAGPSRAPVGDALANRVLVKGEPVPSLRGRADDFIWPRQDGPPVASVGTVEQPAQPTAAAPAQPAALSPQVAPAAPAPPAASEATSPLPPAATPPPAPAKPKHRAAPKPAQRILPPFFDRENPRPPAPINGRSAFGPYNR